MRHGLRAATAGLALLVGGACAADAADAQGRYAVDGAGRMSCARFLSARAEKTPDYQIFAGWVDGYVSAFNHFQEDTFDLTPWRTVELLLAMLEQYCAARPEEGFVSAVNALAQALYADRLTESDEIVQLRRGDQTIFLYHAVVERARRALRDQGYDADEAAGTFTTRSHGALEAFQRTVGLPASGLPDQLTLNRLFGAVATP